MSWLTLIVSAPPGSQNQQLYDSRTSKPQDQCWNKVQLLTLEIKGGQNEKKKQNMSLTLEGAKVRTSQIHMSTSAKLQCWEKEKKKKVKKKTQKRNCCDPDWPWMALLSFPEFLVLFSGLVYPVWCQPCLLFYFEGVSGLRLFQLCFPPGSFPWLPAPASRLPLCI